MKNILMIICFVTLLVVCESVFSYDITLTGVEDYVNATSYTDKTILITSTAYVVYDSNLTLTNCTLDVEGSVECNGRALLLNNSVINVKGNFEVRPGATITEIGASSIIATGDAGNTGRIILKGDFDNRITINSDYIQGSDAELIILESGSSSNSLLKCIDFNGGWCNIQINNKRLNEAISNCCFYGAKYAIWQDGLDELTDIRFSFFYENYVSIHLNMKPVTNSDSEVLVDNVLIDNQYIEDSTGCELVGSQNSSLFGRLKLTNSIFTNCYWSWYFYESYFSVDLNNLAYYDNLDDDPNMAQYQTNAMYLTESPFEEPENINGWPYFINPSSPVADVNLGLDVWQEDPQQLLTSLFRDSTPRTNNGIGFGLPFSQEYFSALFNINGDLDSSGAIDIFDLGIFAQEWLTEKNVDTNSYSIADIDKDGWVNYSDLWIIASNWLGAIDDPNKGDIHDDDKVNFEDFCLLANDWQIQKGPINLPNYPDANGYSIADIDKNGIVNYFDFTTLGNNYLLNRGVVLPVEFNESSLTITCPQILGEEVIACAIFLDGKFIAQRSVENPILTIEKMKYSKGIHSVKAVVKTLGNQYVTVNQNVLFEIPLHDLQFTEVFDPYNNFPIGGVVDAGYSATISIMNFDDIVIWSNSYSGRFQDSISYETFSLGQTDYKISYSYAPSLLISSAKNLFLANASSTLGSTGSGTTSLLALDGPPVYDVAGLVLCMRYDGMKDGVGAMDTGNSRFAARMMEQKGVKVILLKGYGGDNNVSFANIRKAIKKYPKLRYMHIDSHGNNTTDGVGVFGFDVYRTVLEFNDGIRPVYNSRMWTDYGVEVPAGYEWLASDMEYKHCLAQLGFRDLRVVVIEACYALRNVVTIDEGTGLAHYIPWVYDYELNNDLNFHYAYPYSDICIAFNMGGSKQMILGGGDKVVKSGYYLYYSRFFNRFWEVLGNGSTADVAITEANKIAVGCKDVIDNYRIRGAFNLGIIKLTNIDW